MIMVDAVVGAWVPKRTGIRVSPTGSFNDMRDANPVETSGRPVDCRSCHLMRRQQRHDRVQRPLLDSSSNHR